MSGGFASKDDSKVNISTVSAKNSKAKPVLSCKSYNLGKLF